MGTYYHFLDQDPYLKQEDIPFELEELASRLLKSGLIRIDGIERANFVRFKSPTIKHSRVFTKRELYDPRLLTRTKRILSQIYHSANIQPSTNEIIDQDIIRLRNEISKNFPISPILEKKIARLIVQMAESVIIELAILEEVEIFFSYSYMIGDVMDVHEWRASGQNSGMQSLSNGKTQIFISSGGDPFEIKKDQEEDPLYYEQIQGSRNSALARAIIIGAQEFGHYADIIRKDSNYVARHSGDLYLRYFNIEFNNKRLRDIKNIENLYAQISAIGFKNFIQLERAIKFYDKNKLKHFKHKILRIIFYIKRYFFLRKSKISFHLCKFLKNINILLSQ